MYGAALTADGGNEVDVTMLVVDEATLVEPIFLLTLIVPLEPLLGFDEDEFVPALE